MKSIPVARNHSPLIFWMKWLVLAASLVSGSSLAFTCTSTGGNWGTNGTWANCNGTTPQAADTATINSGTVILNASATISGLTVSGGTLTFGSNATIRTLTVNGNVSVANGATLNVSNNTVVHVLNVSGNITNNGTLDLALDANSLCTTNFTGATTHTIDGSSAGTTDFYNVVVPVSNNLTINKSGAQITLSQAGTLSVTGNLTVQAGTLNLANAVTVTGTTSITGTILHSTTTGARTFTGDVTINNGGTMSETTATAIAYGGNVIVANGGTLTEFGNATMSFAGNLQNDGTITASTGIHTFSGTTKTFSGANAIPIPSVTITGTYTNNGTLTVATALAGAGGLTNGATGTLNIGGTSATFTLTATAVGNTVNYTGAAQTVKPTTYYHLGLAGSAAKTLTNVSTVNGNLSLSGTATATTAIALAIGGNLTVGSGTQLTVAGFNIGVTGTTSVTGTLTHNSATGTKTYTGDVTINSGGLLSESAAAAIAYGGNVVISNGGTLTESGAAIMSFAGNLQNDGTLTASTGVHTFSGTTKTFSGANAIPIPSVTITGTYTNNGTLTVATALAGAGGLTNGATGTLNIGGTSATFTLTASAVGNTVNYSGAAQTVKSATYHHLTLSGSGVSPLGGDATVNGTLTLGSGTLSVVGNTLTLNGPAIAGAGANTNLTTTSSSTLVFGGASTGVSVPGSVAALNNLTISNANGITLGGSSVTTTVSSTLTLGANRLTTNSNTLTLAADCSTNSGSGSQSRSSGYVIGNLRLTVPITVTSSTCIYHVGDSIGYAPITVAVGTTAGGTLTGRVDAGDDPDTTLGASGVDVAKSANHYWTLTAGTLSTSVTYSATFQFCANTGACVTPTEVDASPANTGNFIVARKVSSSWSILTAGTRTAYATQATGITNFGEFAVGELNLCFSDGLTGPDGSAPGSTWSVGSRSGTFTPAIYGNRLRLTDAVTNESTWATIQNSFAAASNMVTVVFDHFAYGGTGADGIGVILSDASVLPLAGAFGGSLGYAQKDLTACPAGCPGFAGGWLGFGVDEFGNYSAPTEGRYGGTAKTLNSVAIRGSGNGQSGYRYLAGTGSLTPTIDSDNTPPYHRYRVIVDHSDSTHAWVSLERDTTSGNGTAYQTLIGCPPTPTPGCTPIDVLNSGYSQSAIPGRFLLSFTASTGGNTNIHEIKNLNVCTVQGLSAPTLHHIKIEHSGTACTSDPATVTVKACADAACDALYMEPVQVTLSTSGGTWSPTQPMTITAGQATVTLTQGAAGGVTLGATANSPTTGNPTLCFNGSTQTCTLTFATCTFDAIEVAAAALTPIYTKLAGTAFNLDVLNRAGSGQTATAVQLVDMSSGTCAAPAAVLSPVTVSPAVPPNNSFAGNQRKTFSFTYNNAAPNVRVRVTTAGPIYSCSSDNFAIRPTGFTVTSNATQTGSSGTPVFRAATDGFNLIATAGYNSPAVTPPVPPLTTTAAYVGAPKYNSSLLSTSLATLGILVLPAGGFPAAASGVSTATAATYSEVGNFSLAQYAVYDDTFAYVDSVKGECTPGFSNALDGNGMYSCQFGSAAVGPLGRFVPHHFTVVGGIANACTSGVFTYMDQPLACKTPRVNCNV